MEYQRGMYAKREAERKRQREERKRAGGGEYQRGMCAKREAEWKRQREERKRAEGSEKCEDGTGAAAVGDAGEDEKEKTTEETSEDVVTTRRGRESKDKDPHRTEELGGEVTDDCSMGGIE